MFQLDNRGLPPSTTSDIAAERYRSGIDLPLLSLAINARSAKALERAHTDVWPKDVLILSLPLGAFGAFAFSGMTDHDQARVDLRKRHARHCDADDW